MIVTILNSYMEGEVVSAQAGKQGAGNHRRLTLTGLESLRVTQSEGKYTELSRSGRLWICNPGVIVNHVAAVTDVPTTAAAYALYNPVSSNFNLVVLEVFAITSGTSGVGGALLVSNPLDEATAVTTNTTGVTIRNCMGGSQTAPFYWATGVTLDVAAAWWAVGTVSAAVVKACVPSVEIGGSIIVKPGQVFGTHYYTDTGTTPKAGIGCLVAQYDIDTAL